MITVSKWSKLPLGYYNMASIRLFNSSYHKKIK